MSEGKEILCPICKTPFVKLKPSEKFPGRLSCVRGHVFRREGEELVVEVNPIKQDDKGRSFPIKYKETEKPSRHK